MNLGLDYSVTEHDLQAVLEKGRLQKEFAGLGVQYVAHFALDKTSEGATSSSTSGRVGNRGKRARP